MDISIIIINYNGKDFLQRCLLAFRENSILSSEIIVVDDGSSDGSYEMVAVDFSEVKVLKHKTNKGPAAARNTGALQARGKFLVFCDSDVIIKKNTITQLKTFFDKDQKTAVVGVRIIPKGKEMMWWNFGYFPNHFREIIGFLLGWFIKYGFFSRFFRWLSSFFILNYVDYNKSRKVDWVVETCFAVKKEVFCKIKGFDEKFFMFMEGPDFCKRIKKERYDIWYNAKACVKVLPHHTHKEKRSLYFQEAERYYHQKNSFLIKVSPFLWNIIKAIKGGAYQLAVDKNSRNF